MWIVRSSGLCRAGLRRCLRHSVLEGFSCLEVSCRLRIIRCLSLQGFEESQPLVVQTGSGSGRPMAATYEFLQHEQINGLSP